MLAARCVRSIQASNPSCLCCTGAPGVARSTRYVGTPIRMSAGISAASHGAAHVQPRHEKPITKLGHLQLAPLRPELYKEQLQLKIQTLKDHFGSYSLPEMDTYESQPQHYRMRAEFSTWHEGEDTFYVMHDANQKDAKGKPLKGKVDSFPVASELVNRLMTLLQEHLRGSLELRNRLFQANFLTSLSGQAVVTLVYHRKLGPEWELEARQLRAGLASRLGCTVDDVHVLGRARGQKLAVCRDYVLERMQLADGQTFVYQQVEGSFSQPNGRVCGHMLSWAREVTRPADGAPAGDLLELYCGNGNFTVPLAANFRQVVATEVAKASVAAAQYNLKANGIGNVFLARMSSEEFVQAWRGVRAFNRLAGLDLARLDLRTILVDPPRAGLDGETMQLLQEFDNVVFISCSPPDVLARNVSELSGTHSISRFAVFDQFPFTPHLECGLYMQRKQTVA